jgi:hypothetical protein
MFTYVKYVFFKNLKLKILLQKFQNFEYKVHQAGPNRNCTKNFNSLAFKGDAVGVAQMYANGGGTGQTEFLFFCFKHVFNV